MKSPLLLLLIAIINLVAIGYNYMPMIILTTLWLLAYWFIWLLRESIDNIKDEEDNF